MTKKTEIALPVQTSIKDAMQGSIDNKFQEELWSSVFDVVAEAFVDLIKKWKKWELWNNEDKMLKVLQTIWWIYWWQEKEKKVVHTLTMPKLTSQNIDDM